MLPQDAAGIFNHFMNVIHSFTNERMIIMPNKIDFIGGNTKRCLMAMAIPMIAAMFLYMMLVELGIWIYNFKGWLKRPDKKNNDYGTILIVMLGCWGSFYFSTYFRSQQFIQIAGEILLPHIFYYVGIAFILVGTTLRAVAVWSLRHSFTLSVKTGGNQRLVTTGVYRYIRNPAYAGTMLSMLGNAFCFRSVFSPLLVLLILAICYGIRIKVEEKALYERFGEEFQNYCFRSWRLFPLIW